MKCKNCGKKLNNKDLYCTSCGTKVNEAQINLNTQQTEKKKKLLVLIISIVIVFALTITGIILLTQPDNIDLEAKELSSLIAEEKTSEYYGDNLNVHGYLIRDMTDSSNSEDYGYYILVSDVESLENDSNIVYFSYSGEMDDNLGSGSEVIIHGKLREKSNDSFEILVADNIEVIEKEDPVYQIDFENISNQYIGKKIHITGRLIDYLGQGHYISDSEINNSLQLKGLTEAQFAEYFKNGSWANVIGVLNDDGTISVEKIIQNEYTKELSYDFGLSVNDCYSTKFGPQVEITVHGDYLRNPFNSVAYAIGNTETGQFIELEVSNSSVSLDDYFESGEPCVISGYITEGGRGYILKVTAIG